MSPEALRRGEAIGVLVSDFDLLEAVAGGSSRADLDCFGWELRERFAVLLAPFTRSMDSNNVNGYASVTIGADGLPLLLLYDAYNGALKTIHCANTFCVPYFRRR